MPVSPANIPSMYNEPFRPPKNDAIHNYNAMNTDHYSHGAKQFNPASIRLLAKAMEYALVGSFPGESIM